MGKQDYLLPLGNPAASAFTPLTLVAGQNTIKGQVSRRMFMERLYLVKDTAGDLAGEVNDVRVMKQSVVGSDKSFPPEMLSPEAFDDEGLSLGLGMEASTFVDVVYTPLAGEVGALLSGAVGTAPLPDEVNAGDDDIDAYQWIYGLGISILVAAGQWELTALALRDVYLGRLCLFSTDVQATLESVQIAKAEQMSGDGSISLAILSATATDTDGLTIGKVLRAGESVTLRGQILAVGGTVRGGIYLLDMDELIDG